MTGRRARYFGSLLIAGALGVGSCDLFIAVAGWELAFPDLQATVSDQTRGWVASVSFGQVAVGQPEHRQVRIANTGSEDLLIHDLSIYGDAFGFATGQAPDLPIVVPAGAELDSLWLQTVPLTNGPTEGVLAVATPDGSSRIGLLTTGLWVVMLETTANGQIIAPISVTIPGSPGTITTDDGVLLLEARADLLSALTNWTVTAGAATFTDNEATETIATITDRRGDSVSPDGVTVPDG